MSLADEVLADHKPKSWPGAADWCEWCTDKWPCEAVRLATQLRAAEQVVEAARPIIAAVFSPDDWVPLPMSERLRDALAEYDKGPL